MGCGSSQNQASDTYHPMNSSKPLRIDEMFQSGNSLKQLSRIYLFGQTQTKRKILQLGVQSKTQEVTLRKVSERYHIPRPKIQRDTIEMMYEEAQEVIPLNLHNSTTLPPFNQMFVTALSEKVIFLCGGVDFEFWNVCSESFLYKIASQSNEEERILKLKPQKPQTNILSQKATNLKENSSRKAFNKFQRLGFMNEARYSHMGLSVKHPNSGRNSVYVFGGFGSNKETLKSCEVYCFEKNQWQKLPDMQIPRATGFCFQYLQRIYVCGGFTKEEIRSKKIQVFDLSTDKWSILNIKLHQGIEQGFITSFKPNEIFIAGGNTQGGSTNSVVRFNLIDETYKWDSDLIHVDSLQKALQLSGKLFLFGGNKPNICQVYDSNSQIWTQNKVTTSEEIKCGELTLFSSLSKSLFVGFLPNSSRKKQPEMSSDDLMIFGTDLYPIVYSYHSNDLFVSSKSISMKLRLRKNMGIVRLSANEYFLCGGIDTFQINPTKATFNYNTNTRQVQQLDKMPSKKCKFGIIKHKNYIYCIGGTTTNSKRAEIQLKDSCRYNLLTKKWEKLPQLNFRRSECELLDTEGGLLVFGGYCDGQWVQNVEFLHTDKDKPSEFLVLTAKIPVLYPFYSKVVSKNKVTRQIKVFVLNRNIHSGIFEEVYFNLNLDRMIKKDGINQKNFKDQDDISKLQQFDSIDVIINERVKTMEREQQKHASPFERKKSPLKEYEEYIHKDQAVNNQRQNLKQGKVEPRSSRKEQIVQFYGQKVSQQSTKMPEVQVIQIKSKQSHHQGQQLAKSQSLKLKGQSSADGQKEIQRNQIEDQFAQNMEDIEEMSFEYQKIKLDSIQSKLNQDLQQRQPINYQNIQTEPLQQCFESIQMQNSNVSLPVQPENHPLQEKGLDSSQPYLVETNFKAAVKGLDIIEHPNTWIKIKETCPTLNRVIFVKNETVIKCSINLINSNQVKISIIREKYENGDFLFDSQNSKINNNKLSTHKLKQNYA